MIDISVQTNDNGEMLPVVAITKGSSFSTQEMSAILFFLNMGSFAPKFLLCLQKQLSKEQIEEVVNQYQLLQSNTAIAMQNEQSTDRLQLAQIPIVPASNMGEPE